ncbi:MAG: NADPH-dependent F420 reductase [Candidatus Methanosuratincola sp.]
MNISLLGGTGDIAEGLVLRWTKAGHKILIGSRSDEKAKGIAEEYNSKLRTLGIPSDIEGMKNADAAANSEVVVISLPYEYTVETLGQIKGSFTSQIVISPVVPMKKEGKVFIYTPPPQGSAAEEIREALPAGVRLVSAYHNLPASELRKVEEELHYDVVLCGDDDEAKQVVARLTEDMPRLRALDAGPLRVSSMIEAMTPLIINLNVRYKPRHFSVKFV